MRKYLAYFYTCFNSFSTYKADYIINIVFNLVFFFVYFALWKTIYSANGGSDLGGFSLNNTITYYFMTTLIFRMDVGGCIYLGNDIWSGFFTNDMVKPWNVRLVHISTTIAEIGLNLLLFFPFFLGIFFFAHNYIDLPSLSYGLYFIITLILSFFLNLSFNLIIHAFTFHFGDQDANIDLINYIASFFAGGIFPLVFLSENIRQIFYLLPFKYLFDTPINIFLEKLSVNEILIVWVQILLWIVFFYMIFYFVYQAGIKKYTGTGR